MKFSTRLERLSIESLVAQGRGARLDDLSAAGPSPDGRRRPPRSAGRGACSSGGARSPWISRRGPAEALRSKRPSSSSRKSPGRPVHGPRRDPRRRVVARHALVHRVEQPERAAPDVHAGRCQALDAGTCRHAPTSHASPARAVPDGLIRLIGVLDLLGYARTFHDRIDWERLKRAFPFVINALGCLHYVDPLPDELSAFVPRPSAESCPGPSGVGQTMRPLRSILTRGRPPRAVLNELFHPPDWWMHAYYNVPVNASLNHVRLLRHPWRLARWLGLRASGF